MTSSLSTWSLDRSRQHGLSRSILHTLKINTKKENFTNLPLRKWKRTKSDFPIITKWNRNAIRQKQFLNIKSIAFKGIFANFLLRRWKWEKRAFLLINLYPKQKKSLTCIFQGYSSYIKNNHQTGKFYQLTRIMWIRSKSDFLIIKVRAKNVEFGRKNIWTLHHYSF